MRQSSSSPVERVRIAMAPGIECHIDVCVTIHAPKPERTDAGPIAERLFEFIVNGLPVHIVRQIHHLVG